MKRPRTIVFVGGGTVGHLAPGVTLREALLRRHPDWRAGFLIAGRPVERHFIAPEATCLELFPGRSSRPAPWRADLYVGAWWKAARALACWKPDLLVFLGGYVAFLARLARWSAPMVVLESNAWPGRSARLAAPFAKRVFLQWAPPAETGLPLWRCSVTGMPLSFESVPPKADARARLGLRRHGRVLGVLGGSLGATAVNDRMIAGARDLAAERDLSVVHVTGARDEARVRAAYAAAGVDATVMPFCAEMPWLYAACDLLVARAGGMTVAELAAAGRPAVLVPYPHHKDRHQEWNARMLAEGGAAWVVHERERGDDFVRAALLPRLADPDELELRGQKALRLARRDATRRVVDEIEQLLDLEQPARLLRTAAAV